LGLISYLRGDDLGQKALSGTPAVLEVLSQRRFNGYQSLGGTNLAQRRIDGAYVAMQNSSLGAIYNLTPAVRKVIDYQAGQVAQLGLKLYERVSDDDRQQVGDHPAARSMRRPNPWTPGKKFIRGFVTNFLVYGNAYAVKFPDNDGFMLVEVSPSWVGIVGESHYQVDAYRIWRANGEYFDVAPNQVVHWRGEDPDDPRRGTSKLETAREELAADTAARQANTELHRSALLAPGWIERPVEAPLITEDGLKRLRESLANQAKASRREYPILEEGMTFRAGGVTPEDAELLAARRWTSQEICCLYGMAEVPPRSDEERRQFYSDVLPDITGQLADFLTLQILREDYGLEDHYFEFNLDDKLMGDERIKTLTSAAGAPIMLRDEARAKLNLPALPDGQGEEIIVPANVTEGEGKPSIGVMPIQDPNKPSQDGDFRSGEAEEPDRAGSRASLNGHKELELVQPEWNGHHKAPLIPRRRLASQRRDRWATEYHGTLSKHFDRQFRTLKSKQASTKAITDARWNKELANHLNEVAERHFAAEGKNVAFRLASTFDPAYGQNWLKSKALGSAEAINRITQEQADEFGLEKAFESGESRALAAGMAYATDVAAFSTRVAAEQAPGEPTVIIDGGDCEICAPFQGAWSFSEVQWPSYHAHCNCVADVESAPFKAIPIETKEAPQPVINVTLPAQTFNVQIPEGAFQFKAGDTTIEAPPPAQVSMEAPQVNVAPAEVKFAKGAFEAPQVTVEAAPAPNVQVDAPHVEVQVPPAPEVNINEGAFQVNPAPITVEAPEAPQVNVEVKGGNTKKTIKFSDGRTAEVDERPDED
jgi:HK97 family phage portal protein